ncbi:MAG: hypothetical protein JOZ62_06220 [Acidobacteriaceae bacterium]|nr:hypothetical protein [Acidobacteriaceae bacterium]
MPVIDPTTLADEGIFEMQSLVSEVSFRLKDIQSIKVRVKIWRTAESHGGDDFLYTVSHFVQTPVQASAYFSSSPFGASAQAAAKKAIDDTTTFVKGAIEAGHSPSEEWLKPNEDF